MQAAEREGAAGGPEATAAAVTGGGEASLEPPSPPKAAAFDLLDLVRSYRRLELYLEPLRDAAEGVRSLLRWQRPLCSLLVCLGLNFLLLTLDQAAWYSVLALLVLLPALLGYLQETCRVRPSERELLRRKYHSVRREDLRKVQLSRQEALAQVKCLFYGALLGSVCILYLLPLCWVMAILNSTLFLGNSQFYQVIKELKASVEQSLGTKPLESTPEPAKPLPTDAPPDRTPTPTSTEDLTPGSVEEAEEAEPDEEFKDAIEENQLLVMEDDEGSQCSADFDLSLPDNGFMSKNDVIRSKVSRLTERLRKRYPSNNFGSCTGCGATFSVLKKRVSLQFLQLTSPTGAEVLCCVWLALTFPVARMAVLSHGPTVDDFSKWWVLSHTIMVVGSLCAFCSFGSSSLKPNLKVLPYKAPAPVPWFGPFLLPEQFPGKQSMGWPVGS
ncbi:protrudin isoform X3 [Numida meleagris]|uniref:protrudin isoform X3 n=1 Tax=Numida meleagris TaxID=8996 RepID=UPI000B3D960E|nr:protrudin isoform X3 [Numida meleagris]